MSRAADILNYFASRANSSSADIREGARTAVGLAYDLFWAPVTVPKAVISIGLGLPPVRALVLTPLLLLHRSCTVRSPLTTLHTARGEIYVVRMALCPRHTTSIILCCSVASSSHLHSWMPVARSRTRSLCGRSGTTMCPVCLVCLLSGLTHS